MILDFKKALKPYGIPPAAPAEEKELSTSIV